MKIIVALSGGMDSTTLLAAAVASGHEVIPVSIKYPSKHNLLERTAAGHVAEHYELTRYWQTLDLTSVFEGFQSDLLTSGKSVPEGHYHEESMRRTVVPFRNGIIVSVLAGLAESLIAQQVWIGIHAGDHFIYPDCRPAFYWSMKETVFYGTDNKVVLFAPFLDFSKADILSYGTKQANIIRLSPLHVPVPYHLTRTCYTNNLVACGRCGACQERLESFQEVGVTDPIEYQSRELLSKKG